MKYSWLFIVMALAIGCKKESPSKSNDKAVYAEAPALDASVNDSAEATTMEVATTEIALEKKIIKTANLVFESKDINASSLWIKQLVQKNKGYIATETSEGNESRPAVQFLIRVPSASFNQLLNDISSEVSSFDRKSIERKDVTEEYIDVESRLKTKKELENRYLQILKQAKSIADILEIENKLSSIREEIEATEGRLKYLQNQVSMSTVEVNIYKNIPYSPTQKESFFSQVGTAFVQGFYYLTDFFIGLIYIWPFIIIISLVFYFAVKRFRKKKRTP